MCMSSRSSGFPVKLRMGIPFVSKVPMLYTELSNKTMFFKFLLPMILKSLKYRDL